MKIVAQQIFKQILSGVPIVDPTGSDLSRKRRLHETGSFNSQGDAEKTRVFWRASAAVRRGDQLNQGLSAIDLATKVSEFI